MVFPWYIETNSSPGIDVFSKKIFFLLMLGGILEFLGNHTLVFAFNNAFQANMNTGICMALFVSNSILVLIASYFMFHERVSAT
jgi:hypothetical protein